MVIHQTPTMVKAVDILPLGQMSAGAHRIDNFILGGGLPTRLADPSATPWREFASGSLQFVVGQSRSLA